MNRDKMLAAAKKLEEMTLLEQFLFSTMAAHRIYGEPFCRIILETVMHRDLKHLKVTVENVIGGVTAGHHGVRLDAKIEEYDTLEDYREQTGTLSIYDIEPDQKESKKKELPRRTRYYHALLNRSILASGTDYGELPDTAILVITPFDPFDQGRMLYTVRRRFLELPQMEYEDGETTYYLYTEGSCDDTDKRLQELLSYLAHSDEAHAVNETLKQLHQMVTQVKKEPEVTIGYMKWFEYEKFMIEEATEKGLADGLEKGRLEQMERTRAAEARAAAAEAKAEKYLCLLRENNIKFE